MSFTQLLEENKTSGSNNEFYLKDGTNIFRVIDRPIAVDECFCISEQKDENGNVKKGDDGKALLIKRSEPIYEGCGYAGDKSKKFICYVIDSQDQLTEDGKAKIKVLSFGWKILEGFVNLEKAREVQGLGAFETPMTLDTIIQRSGSGLTTTYGVQVMFSEAGNKVTVSPTLIAEARLENPSLQAYWADKIKDAKDRHARFGMPMSEKAYKLSKKIADVPAMATVQLDEPVDDSGEVNPNDIPF